MDYGMIVSTTADWPIVGQIAWVFGQIMNAIYNFLNLFGIQNIGICIILFTIIVYTLMIPLTVKQQKFSKMQSVMMPEIQKLQKKYEGKRDQASMLKMQEEQRLIYEKYGSSPVGGCLPLLIQMPILFALYPVIQEVPRYVAGIRDIYMPLVNHIMETPGYQKVLEAIGSASPVFMSPSKYDYTQASTLVRVLYKFQDSTWDTLLDKLPSLDTAVVNQATETMSHLNSFLGINIGEAPMTMLMQALENFSVMGIVLAVIIPIMAGLSQFISVKLSPQPSSNTDMADNPMANSMKTMTYVMPLFSVFMGFSLPAGLGLYWAVSALVRCVQQVLINKYLSKKTVEDLIEENRKKAAKKREKHGVPAQEINRMATANTKNVVEKKVEVSQKEKEEKLEKAKQTGNTAKPGSLAAKANLVSRYNNAQDRAKVKGESKE
ncbi:MAG: YidC/Oxa1 family membrane protein insertase [Candidatus Ruminococcus intestinipullorum]|nr:YidC/Oxa1 family membrane protein insertase [Candidatus Ruminococcus intestinipullorum]